MPGQVPRQSTQALTNSTLPYIKLIANKGIAKAIKQNAGLKSGVNVRGKKIKFEAVAEALHMEKYYEKWAL